MSYEVDVNVTVMEDNFTKKYYLSKNRHSRGRHINFSIFKPKSMKFFTKNKQGQFNKTFKHARYRHFHSNMKI